MSLISVITSNIRLEQEELPETKVEDKILVDLSY